MNDERYDTVNDLLPDWVAGRLDAQRARRVEEAVAGDAELAAEAVLLESLLAARPEPPPGLEARIHAAVRRDRAAPAAGTDGAGRRSTRPWWLGRLPAWGLAAAAVAVLTLGTLELMDRRAPAPGQSALDLVALEDAPSPWASEDGVVAGAPVLDGLSDEALAALLEELGG